MNMHSDWTIGGTLFNDIFYNCDETVKNVQENFDIRRFSTSEGKDIEINGIIERCIVQTSSNPLHELNDFRKIHCPITSDVKRGYYVKFEDYIWLIDTNVVNVDGAYLSTRMSRCLYLLRWQNNDGKIVERWGCTTDETKYSSGKTGNNVIMVADNQYGLIVPIDNETKQLKRGMRFPFDFDDADEPDIYTLNNRKVNLKDNIMVLSFSIEAFNESTDKLVELDTGEKVWICNYRSPVSTAPPAQYKPETLFASISGSETLKCGYPRIYTVQFLDENGIEMPAPNFSWSVLCNFNISQYVNGNTVELCVEDDSLVGNSLSLRVISDTEVMSEMKITIIGGF